MSSESERRPSPRPGSTPGFPAVPAPDTARAQAQDVDEPVPLTDARAMRAVAHPVRMALIELFGYHDTLTATQASELLGESPANCAFHLRTLAKYGFVREAGGGKGRERPWTLVNRSVTITSDQPDPQAALAADELARLWLERWMDRARRAFGARNQVPGWDEASGWSNTHVFLTPEEAATLRGEMRWMLLRYEDRLTDPTLRPEGALPVEWTVFASPVPELAEPTGQGSSPDGPGADRGTDQEDPDADPGHQHDIS
jgi:predicted transcriptional regulator